MIIDIEGVTVMDVSGLVALDSAIERLRSDGVLVAVAEVHGQPALLMRRAEFTTFRVNCCFPPVCHGRWSGCGTLWASQRPASLLTEKIV